MRTLIAGANRGLGLELTRQYLERGDQAADAACRQPADSARGISRLVEQLLAEENGSFVTWQGRAVPW